MSRVCGSLNSPVAGSKTWNAIGIASIASKGEPVGELGRIPLPVAADRDDDCRAALSLVEDMELCFSWSRSRRHVGQV